MDVRQASGSSIVFIHKVWSCLRVDVLGTSSRPLTLWKYLKHESAGQRRLRLVL